MMDLKPCPFCGGKVKFAYDIQFLPSGIQCIKCHMVVKFYRVKPSMPHEPFERELSEYAEAWNRRTKE